MVNTPSGNTAWKWTLRLRPPKRWTKVTAGDGATLRVLDSPGASFATLPRMNDLQVSAQDFGDE